MGIANLRGGRGTALAAIALGALIVTGGPASAAGPEAPRPPDELQEEALALARGGELVEAAEMLVEGAGELDESAEATEVLVLAARLYGHAARSDEAYLTLRRAAEMAFRVGESERAAHLLIDAAVLAMEEGRRADANEAADLAGYVLRVSNLTAAQRLAVLQRVQYPVG